MQNSSFCLEQFIKHLFVLRTKILSQELNETGGRTEKYLADPSHLKLTTDFQDLA